MAYSIKICIDVDDLRPLTYLRTLEQVEAAIEGVVGEALEPMVINMVVQTVEISSGQIERDWDALLRS